jgi:hypothetical protein
MLSIQQAKRQGERFVMLTACDALMAAVFSPKAGTVEALYASSPCTLAQGIGVIKQRSAALACCLIHVSTPQNC